MTEPHYTISETGDRVAIACDTCRAGMETTATGFGRRMIATFANQHHCKEAL